MQDKEPLNKTNYTTRLNGSLPKETAYSLWWEKRKKSQNERRMSLIQKKKNYQHQFSENVPQNMDLTFKDNVKARKDFGDKQ